MTTFRSRTAALLLLPAAGATLLLPSRAQAAATGSIVGRVVQASSDTPIPGVRVTLLGAERDGSNPVRRTEVTARDGTYSFNRVTASDTRIYALNARYRGGLFAGGAIHVPANTARRPVIKTQLRVWPTTTDPSAVLIARDDLFVQQDRDSAGVIESITVQNNTDAAYIGRGADVAGGGKGPVPTLGFALPAGASRGGFAIVQSDLDIPQLVPTDFGVAATTALPPGSTRVTYSYRVQGLVGSTDLSRTALYPTAEVSIFAAPPLQVQSNRLTRTGQVTVGNTEYARWSSTGSLAPGDELQALATARAGLAPGLIAGVVAGAALFALAGGLFLVRGRRRRTEPATAAAPRGRDDLLLAIARLDRGHDAGEVGDDEWERTRARLRSEAERLS